MSSVPLYDNDRGNQGEKRNGEYTQNYEQDGAREEWRNQFLRQFEAARQSAELEKNSLLGQLAQAHENFRQYENQKERTLQEHLKEIEKIRAILHTEQEKSQKLENQLRGESEKGQKLEIKLREERDAAKSENQKLQRQLKDFETRLGIYEAKEKEQREKEEQERVKREKLEREERERKARVRPYYLQNKVSSFPGLLEGLKEFGINLGDISTVPTHPAPKLCFYVVNHTARFETVNFNAEVLKTFKSSYPTTEIVLIAMTPGDSSNALPAPKQISGGESVITLWYRNNSFAEKDNASAYEQMRECIRKTM